MTKDRLAELKKPANWPSVIYKKISLQDDRDDESSHQQSITIDLNKSTVTTDFLREIDAIRSEINDIKEPIEEIRGIHKQLLEPLPDSNLAKILDKTKSQVLIKSDQIAEKLTHLENKQRNMDRKLLGPAQWRIQESQFFVMKQFFRETMVCFEEENLQHRQLCKKAIEQELELAGCSKTNEEIEEIIEKGVPGAYNFSALLDVEQARQSLDIIQVRHEHILEVEKTIEQINRMFRDMASLIGDQGNMIDSIEYYVKSAEHYINEGKKEVEIAEKEKTKLQKKKYSLVLIIIAGVAILLLIFFLFFSFQRVILG